MSKIFTIDLNPTIDEILYVSGNSSSRKNSIIQKSHEIGGKGLNISCALASLEMETENFSIISHLLEGKLTNQYGIHKYIKINPIFHTGEIRKKITILDKLGLSYKFVEKGVGYNEDLIDEMVLKLENKSKKDDIWVLNGTLGPNLYLNQYLKFITAAQNLGVKIVFQLNGEDLNYILQHHKPFLIRLNRAELVEYLNFIYLKAVDFDDVPTLINYCEKLVKEEKAQQILLTLDKDGVVLFSKHNGIVASSTNNRLADKYIIDTSFSGEASLGAFLYAIRNNFNDLDAIKFCCSGGFTTATFFGMEFGTFEDILDNQKFLD